MPSGGTDNDGPPTTNDYYSSSTKEETERPDHAISGEELIGGSIDDTSMQILNGRPENYNNNALAATSTSIDCEGDKSEPKDKSQDEMTSPPRSEGNQFSPLSAATPSETTSLLTRGVSLFSRGSRQVRPTRNEVL